MTEAVDIQAQIPAGIQAPPEKPLLRGWFHAAAALGAVALTVALAWASRRDTARLISLLVFGLSMVELYTVSAVYHIGAWPPRVKRVLRSVDHANIFVLIAGTYTPICVNVLSGWVRVALLTTIWVLAAAGVGSAMFTHHIPRWVTAVLYIGVGWAGVLALPAFKAALPWAALGVLLLGGVLYTLGAVVYALKRPDPFPRVLGFHEVFHLFVVAGGAAFAIMIWIWVLPHPRI
jgi:hemolysin III